VLVIEDQQGNRELILEALTREGLEVEQAVTGETGIQKAARFIPQAILLSTSLPDMSGVEVAERLREINRTKHVFLMMIGDEDNRTERLRGLEAGANDFTTSPVDPDLVMLRVRNAINRANLDNNTDPVTGMPAGRRLQDELMRLVRDPEGPWVLIRFRIQNLEPFREVHGFMAGDDLLRATARILAGALGSDDIADDFLGYGGHDDFIVITDQSRGDDLIEEVKTQFAREIETFYGFMEREQGYIEFEGEQYPLASLRVRKVTPEEGPFYDIRSLSEALTG
jgi:PleD family two-component response regulator